MEAGLRRNTIVRKASITQGDRVQLKGEERRAADVTRTVDNSYSNRYATLIPSLSGRIAATSG